MKNLILLSGGVESTTLLYEEAAGAEALFIDYGQRAAARERDAAQEHAARLAIRLTMLAMPAVGEAFRERQTQRLHVPLPHRNLVALSLGLSFAAQVDAGRLCLALNREDLDAYASASEPFLTRFRALAATLGDIEIATPLAALTKAQIVARGAARGIDYARTYSCLLGHALHCGHCPQCRKRRAAFAEAGIEEPDAFYRSD